MSRQRKSVSSKSLKSLKSLPDNTEPTLEMIDAITGKAIEELTTHFVAGLTAILWNHILQVAEVEATK